MGASGGGMVGVGVVAVVGAAVMASVVVVVVDISMGFNPSLGQVGEVDVASPGGLWWWVGGPIPILGRRWGHCFCFLVLWWLLWCVFEIGNIVENLAELRLCRNG